MWFGADQEGLSTNKAVDLACATNAVYSEALKAESRVRLRFTAGADCTYTWPSLFRT